MRKNDEPIPDFHEVKVKLKPLLGVKPAVYVPVIYFIITSLVLFFVLFYPGIKNNGSYIEFTSVPGKAAVKVDGKFLGSTPFTEFIKSGERNIEISKPYYDNYIEKVNVPGRVFATLFFPVKTSVQAVIKLTDMEKLLQWKFNDFSHNPFIPEILTDTVSVLYSIPSPSVNQLGMLKDFLKESMFFIQTEDGLKYLLNSYGKFFSMGGIFTAPSLQKTAASLAELDKKYPFLFLWFTSALKDREANKVTGTEWFRSRLKRYIGMVDNFKQPFGLPKIKIIELQGLPFAAVPGASFLMGNTVDKKRLGSIIDLLSPVPVKVDPFYIMTREVSRGDYRKFLAENPFWRKSNISKLIKKGLVSEDYLKNFPDKNNVDDNLPVTYVSFYAASAYSDWLTGKISGYNPAYRFRLPSEKEWEWAARGGLDAVSYPNGSGKGNYVFFGSKRKGPKPVKASLPNRFGIYDMSGNVWEWCDNWYSPVSYFLNPGGPLNGAAKVVRGGSWANPQELVPLYQRGSQPPEWSTGYLGFRIVMVKK
ncbi:MAG: SUMF1/EgtB/PvdO family nonheme iron enzyme [Spirochaetes bacterium]|nr:SUMF1/EgtB/PvdO family nonheme iron enzyme [Spirochaetota bacterium]